MKRWNQFIKDYQMSGIAARFRTSENTVLLGIATLLGLTVGFCIWLFRQGIDLFHEASNQLQSSLAPTPNSIALVCALTLAGAIVGLIMERFIGEERHHGVAGIMESVALGGGRLRYRRMPFKALASALSLGAGASVGPEDPSVQIGANLGSWFGEALRVKEDYVRVLVAAGAASAISAAFGAPIAGVFFAIEVILNGAFEIRSFGFIVLASVMSAALTQAIQPMPEMGPFNYTLGSPLVIPLFIPLGLILALVSVLFVRTVYWQHDLWHHYVHLPRPLRTALAGAAVGVAGVFLPQIMGTGRDTMSAVLSGKVEFGLTILFGLAFFKILMTAVSMAGGFVGGIFAPALFVGTMVGSLYGKVIQGLFGSSQLGDPQAYAIVGMAATMAGVVRSPITAIMLVFELTNDYRLILPIMLATVICVSLAEHFEPHGIYMNSLLRKGVRLPQGREIDLMQGVTVAEAMLKPAPTILESASLTDLRDTLQDHRSQSVCVLDSEGRLCGIVTLSDLQRAFRENGASTRSVSEICVREVVTVYPDQLVWEAIQLMGTRDVGRIPVIERESHAVVGLIGRHGILRAYRIAIARKVEDQHIAEQIRLNSLTGGHFVEKVVTANTPVVGHKIRSVSWPKESSVAAIRRRGRLIVPHGDTEFQVGDTVILLGNGAVEQDLTALFEVGQTEIGKLRP